MAHALPETGMSEMSDATNVRNGGMSRRVSEVGDLLLKMAVVPPDATVDFVDKLAREHGWGRDRAQRAYDEYLRFLLMAWVSPDMVVPSHDVDQAWHLHLTHSRHYWEVLCGEILQRPFHHEPSLGGEAEDTRHADAYGRTLALYEHIFDETAPLDVWPRGCGCHEAVREPVRDVVLASTPLAPIILLGGAMGISCWALGGGWITLVIALGTVALCILASHLNAAEREEEERRAYRERRDRIREEGFRRAKPVEVDPAVLSTKLEEMRERTRAASASSRVVPKPYRSSRSSRGYGGSRTYDRSGDDAGASFAMLMATSSSDTGSHSHSHSHSSHSSHSCSSSSHSSHSCSSSSSHSCSSSSSSHSCGSSSSCGGSSCGGSSCGSS